MMIIWIDRKSFRQLSPVAFKLLSFLIAEQEDGRAGKWITIDEICEATGLLPLEVSAGIEELKTTMNPYSGEPILKVFAGRNGQASYSAHQMLCIDEEAGQADVRYEMAPDL